MNNLLTFDDVHRLTQGTWLTPPRNPTETLRSGAFDTRSLGDAQIFFAFKTAEGDGHEYLENLVDSQIRLIIVEQSILPVGDMAILKVRNSLETLHTLANALAESFKGKIVTITGSSGKTTAKTWLGHVLKSKFHVLHNEGSFNNQIGCPITILNMDPNHDVMILEMGTSGLGELDLLSSIAPADISVLLNVGHAHIGEFGNRENIYIAKSEIFSHQRKSAKSLIPYNDETIRQYAKNRDFRYFGKRSPDFSWKIVKIDPDPPAQIFSFKTPWGEKEVCVNQLGEYVGDLISAIIAISYFLGIDWQDIEPSLKTLPQEKGRSTFVQIKPGFKILDDTYNANPESTINMLKTICLHGAHRTIAVVGNLAELEEDLVESAAYIVENIPDKLTHLILSGETGQILLPLIKEKFPKLDIRWIESIPEISDVLSTLIVDDTILGIKGSRSAHMERVLYALWGKIGKCGLNRCGRLSMCRDCEEF